MAPVLLKEQGASANNWLSLDLKALNDNKSAIGTKVEVFAGPNVPKMGSGGASGYLGQSAPFAARWIGESERSGRGAVVVSPRVCRRTK